MDSEDTADLSRRRLLQGAVGATAVVGGAAATSGTAAAQEQEIMAGTSSEPLAFVPDSVTVTPGTTVTWVWGTDGHNIVVDSQPDGAEWEGHEDIEDTGFEYSHTFEVEGTYEYFCRPHLANGMEGTIEVSEDAGGGDGGGAVGPPKVPESALNFTLGIMGLMSATIAGAFFFIKYGGSSED